MIQFSKSFYPTLFTLNLLIRPWDKKFDLRQILTLYPRKPSFADFHKYGFCMYLSNMVDKYLIHALKKYIFIFGFFARKILF